MPKDFIDFNQKTGFICDMDGVIYHGNRILPGVADFIQWLHEESKEYLFLTSNSGYTPRELQQKLARLGLDVDEIEKRAFWFGAADAAEEMIGFHGLFRATPLYKGVRKLLRTKKGAGVRAHVSGSPAAQYALQGVAGTVEEGILEPTAGYLMRSASIPCWMMSAASRHGINTPVSFPR